MNHLKPTFAIEPSTEGPPTLAVTVEARTIYLHSRVNPTREAELFRKNCEPEKFDLLMVLGLGLGYHLAPIARQVHRYRRVILVDLLEGVENHWSGPVADLPRQTGRVTVLTGIAPDRIEASLAPLLNLENASGIQVLEHPASMRAFPAYYGGVKSIIETIINRAAGNHATVTAFGYRYIMNGIQNISMLPAMRPFSELFGRFTAYPALVITPGPSLDGILSLIRENQHRFFIIAADSALPVLSNSGITADFLVSIDPQAHLYEHFVHGRMGRTVPVYALPVHPLPFRHFPGMVYLNSHPLCQLLEEHRPGLFGSANSATGTVAGDAIAAALRLGFSSLGLAGFDFSFPRFSIYARGSAYQERFARYFQTRMHPSETRNLSYIMGSSRGERHGVLYTRKSFLRYREGIGKLLADGATEAVVLTDGGLAPEGVPCVEPETYFQKYGKALSKEKIISEYIKSIPFLSKQIDIRELFLTIGREDILDSLLLASLRTGPGSALYDRCAVRIRDFISMYTGI